MTLLVKLPKHNCDAERLKRTVLAKYSGKNRAECSVPSCRVRCLDMLQLDHIRNNALWSAKTERAGIALYRRLRRAGYPTGYQTLCANHHALKTAYARHGGTLRGLL
jgi:hypothetical protein